MLLMRLAVLAAAALSALAPGASPARAQDELAVGNFVANSVTVYPRTASGNTAPLRTLQGPATSLGGPEGIVMDFVHGELLVANFSGNAITVYPRTASGNTPPLRRLQGPGTMLAGPNGMVLDLVHDELVAANDQGSITVHARTASGNTPPLRVIQGSATGLAAPAGVALDLVHGELVITDAVSDSISVFARTTNGNAAPLRTIRGNGTGLDLPIGVVVDLVHDEILVANLNGATSTITAYPRTANGNTAPLRTLRLGFPIGLGLDLVHDELVVATQSNAVAVYRRTASGNAAPLRTLEGGSTGLGTPQFAAVSTSPPLAAAVLPLSRSHQVGTLLTAFATIINGGPGPAQQCLVRPPASRPAGLGPFVFQTTNPISNVPTGTLNAPASVPADGFQTFVFGFTPTGVIPPTSLAMNFLCENTTPAPTDVTSFLLVTSADPVPDTVAVAATISGDGVVRIPGASGTQAFAVATANVGAPGMIVVSADTGNAGLPVTMTVCETGAGGLCTAPPAPTVTIQFDGGTTRSFAFFAQASGSIPFVPGANRAFAWFRDPGGVTRGATSAAICTAPNPGC
jgi:hypothetical protein